MHTLADVYSRRADTIFDQKNDKKVYKIKCVRSQDTVMYSSGSSPQIDQFSCIGVKHDKSNIYFFLLV